MKTNSVENTGTDLVGPTYLSSLVPSLGMDTSPTSTPAAHDTTIQLESVLQSFLILSDSTNTPCLNCVFDSLIESDRDENMMIERAIRLGSVLVEAGKRAARKRGSLHNAVVWPLPADLTIKVHF